MNWRKFASGFFRLSLCASLAAATGLFARGTIRTEFTVTGYTGGSALTNFPVLVRISEDRVQGFSYDACAPGGADLDFTLTDQTALPREIDTWNPGGESLVWVLLPECKDGVRFQARFGDRAVVEQPPCQTNGAVWRPSGYIGVWHMGEVDAKDSTGLGNDGTLEGDAPDPGARIVPGKVGLAQNFDGKRINCGKKLDPGFLKEMSVEGWACPADAGNGGMFGLHPSFTAKFNTGHFTFTTPTLSDHHFYQANLAENQWTYAAITFLPSKPRGAKAYQDGVLKNETDASSINPPDSSLWIGGNDWNENFRGILDELRISKVIRSADWILGCHETMADEDFLTVGETIEEKNSLQIATSPSCPLPGADPALGLKDGIAAGESFLCSAPSGLVEAAEGVRAFCTGWRLYSFDETTSRFFLDETRENAVGTSTSFTYVHPDPAVCSRLEWQLVVSNRVMAAANDTSFGDVSPRETWAAAGDPVTVTAVPSGGSSFYKWTGDVQGNDPMDTSITLSADRPLDVVAVFRPVLYVSPDGDDANDGQTAGTPKKTIGAAVAAAPAAAMIRLLPGVHVVSSTVVLNGAIGIVGDGEKTVVTRDGNLATNVLDVAHAEACVKNLVVDGAREKGRSAVRLSRGGMLLGCVVRNTKTRNLQADGAALYLDGDGVVRDCVFTNNHTQTSGGGGGSGGAIYMTGGLVERCAIRGNKVATGSGAWGGGGVYIKDGVLRNSLITGNLVSVDGSGVFAAGGRVENCTIADNVAPESTTAGGVVNNGAAFVNCIIHGNRNRVGVVNYKTNGAGTCSHTCSTPLIAGEGNVEANPQFADPAGGDYSTGFGACVDAGVALPWHAGARDLAGLPRVNGAAPDMGCHEYAGEGLAVSLDVSPGGGFGSADVTLTANVAGAADPAALVYTWDFGDGSAPVSGTGLRETSHRYGPGRFSPSLAVSDGAGGEASSTLADAVQVTPATAYVVMTNSAAAYPYDSWEKAATDIRDAVAACGDGSEIVVSNGLYLTDSSIEVVKAISIVSLNGPAVTTVRATGHMKSAFYGGVEGVVIEGFTIEGLNYSAVELAHGGTLRDCVVRGVHTVNNTCEGAGVHIYDGGAVVGCVVRDNFLQCSGGWGGKGGGILAERGVLVSGCVISGNTIDHGNVAHGGGIALVGNGCVMRNSLVCGNSCCDDAGGIYASHDAIIENCTVVSNRTDLPEYDYSSGVTLTGSAVARNMIVRGNYFGTGDVERDVVTAASGSSVFRFSDVSPADEVRGEGNFRADPVFKNPAAGDYRLKSASPCLDRGETLEWMGTAVDLDGNPRVVRRAVDLGCYENGAILSTLILLR